MDDGSTLDLARAVREVSTPLDGSWHDYDELIERVGEARVVLLGEASHGTHEFYRERARITRRLIAEKGFRAIAVEGDWPDTYRVHRYVSGLPPAGEGVEALAGVSRVPPWMWRNADVLDFIGWLRSFNEDLGLARPKVGFYGLDLYGLYSSIDAVISYLDRVDPEEARRARERYGCFEPFARSTESYGRGAGTFAPTCEAEVVAQLVELQKRRPELVARGGWVEEEERFWAEQNARPARNAEEFYRAAYRASVESWNLRDTHMADTLDALLDHLERRLAGARIVVWAHNSHVGDGRATELADSGELNLGELARQRHGRAVANLGFTTWAGTVTAARTWGGEAERMRVRPALSDSVEDLMHYVGLHRFLLDPSDSQVRDGLMLQRLERAIGVLYLPQTERVSHYFHVRLPEQFDFVVHLDETRAGEPVERAGRWMEPGLAPTLD